MRDGKKLLFISHATKEVHIAQWLKTRLENLGGVTVFVAHEDIEPTDAWREEIIRALQDCDGLIAVLSEAYDASDWCDQETGFVAVSGRPVIPVMYDRKPRGFLEKFQGLRWDDTNDASRARSLTSLLPKLSEREILDLHGMIDQLRGSTSYQQAGQRAELIASLGKIPQSHLSALLSAIAENSEVRDSYSAQDALKPLLALSGKVWPD